ncbi:MAG TPA: SDR family oxidoreductase [Thermoanaerobaculia bacterium]|nr:SDR family oxidoreductase [Thermoanaerobaculia bacterium]
MILITGATGTVGGHLVDELVERGIPARLLVRSRARAAGVEGSGMPLAVGDLERPETLEGALDGIERVFLLSAPSPHTARLHANLVDAARRAGVRHVVRLSAWGARADADLGLLRWHGEAEAHLEASGLAWTHLRPASFLQNLFALAPRVIAGSEIAAPAGDGAQCYVDAADVARAAAEVLTGDGHEGAAYTLTGPEALTYHELAATLTAVVGRPVRYRDQPADEARRGMVAAGMPEWLAEEMVRLHRKVAAGRRQQPSPDVERLTGRPPASFADFAHRNAGVFRGDEATAGAE